MRAFSIVEHTADAGIDCWADSLDELFRAAAEGLRFILLGDIPAGESAARKLELNADSPEALIREWLAELLYLFESEGLVFGSCEFEYLDDLRLVANLKGEIYDSARHKLLTEVKAVTWHGLKVERGADGIYKARVIFDL